MARVPVPEENQRQVLLGSRRRCCVCYGLNGDLQVKQGQIAHLDHDNANFELDNLAFLCLPRHDQYDSKTSQSKGLRESEVKGYRKELYDRVTAGLPDEPATKGTRILAVREEAKGGEEALPNVGSLHPEVVSVTYDKASDIIKKSNQEEEDETSCFAVVLPFSNDPRPGKKTLPLQGLRARITYYKGDQVYEFKRVDSGCWLGDKYEYISLEVGGIAYLVAALSIDGHGAFVEIPRRSLANYNDTMLIDHLPNGRYEVKVSLISGEHGEYSEEYWYQLDIAEQISCKRINPF